MDALLLACSALRGVWEVREMEGGDGGLPYF